MTHDTTKATPATQAAATPDIRVEHRDGGEVRITIDRAHKHNALSMTVLNGIAQQVTAAGADPQTRLVLLAGAGERYFAAGGDLVDLASVRTEEAVLQMTDQSRVALDAIRHCPVPVVAFVNGDAIGGGGELALACDMRLMAARARIGFVQGKLAITTAWGGGVDLCQLIGAARAMRMLTRCEMVDADTAVHWGLADGVVSDGIDGHDLRALLAPMLERTPLVMRGIKAQTRAWRDGAGYAHRRDIEQRHLVGTWLHDDHWRAADKLLSKDKR